MPFCAVCTKYILSKSLIIKCGDCLKSFHPSCANVSREYVEMTKISRSNWKCDSCKKPGRVNVKIQLNLDENVPCTFTNKSASRNFSLMLDDMRAMQEELRVSTNKNHSNTKTYINELRTKICDLNNKLDSVSAIFEDVLKQNSIMRKEVTIVKSKIEEIESCLKDRRNEDKKEEVKSTKGFGKVTRNAGVQTDVQDSCTLPPLEYHLIGGEPEYILRKAHSEQAIPSSCTSSHLVPHRTHFLQDQHLLWQVVAPFSLSCLGLHSHSACFLNSYDVQLLVDVVKVLDERKVVIDQHILKLKQVTQLRQKVRQQLEKIDEAWDRLIADEKRECDLLTAERDQLEEQMKSENLMSSKESIYKSQQNLDLSAKGSKPPPSRVGNYTIMAKRLQSEIKNIEREVQDMKDKLNQEIENKINLEYKVKEVRTGLALHKRMDVPGTPTL